MAHASGIVSHAKSLVVPKGRKPRSIVFGPLRGVRMQLDLAHHTQMILGLYEREIMPDLARLAKGATTGVDVGMEEGTVALYMLRNTPIQTVFAFEPLPECLAVFDENLALNDIPGDKTIDVSPLFVGNAITETSTTLDAIASRIQRPAFIKVDVEGAEVDVLHGARSLLGPGVSWLIETHSEANELDCMAILADAGYEPRIVKNARWRAILPDKRPLAHNRWLVAEG